jgi:formylglycine-generating enzyme required for sulfatase activity
MRRLAVAIMVSAISCGVAPRPQLVLHFDTDAPVPSREPRHIDAFTPIALFDRLRVDVFPPGASEPCSGCRNEFQVDSELFAAGKASIGVLTPVGAAGWRARVRLFLGRLVDANGEPTSGSTIDVWAALPVQRPEGVVHATVMLRTDDVGLVPDPNAPVPASAGAPVQSKVGSWPPSIRRPCGPTIAGTVCVPGGAFWMGNKAASATEGHDPTWHRLVTVAPFSMDPHEVSVAEFRAGGGSTAIWNGSNAGAGFQDWCTFTKAPGPRDALPVSCVAWRTARPWCANKGGDLPTEAQLELVATSWGSAMFAWGNDVPSCSDAVWGRGGFGFFAGVVSHNCRSSSMALGMMGGPEPAGSGALDAIAGADGTIVDISGNVSEWVRDRFADENEPCWTGRILNDPWCAPASSTDPIVGRSGAWNNDVPTMRGDRRFKGLQTDLDVAIGFRCVYPTP